MPAIDLTKIVVGGPCKIVDPNGTIYFEDAVTIEPVPVWREVPSSVTGGDDDNLIGLTWSIKGRPKSIWSSPYRSTLLPDAYINWSCAGARMCGTSNRTVSIIGSDSHGFDITRGCLTKMPSVFLGLGESLYDEVEWTAFLGQGKAISDADAFLVENTTAWDQSDFPTGHQEALCTGAWGAVTGWDTVWAENGFKLTHDLKTKEVKSGNILVDRRITGYRPMISFTPQEPTTTQLLTGLGYTIGTRRSANAFDFVTAGSGISVTVKKAACRTGKFHFDSSMNRHGELAMISALQTPGTRLVFA